MEYLTRPSVMILLLTRGTRAEVTMVLDWTRTVAPTPARSHM